MRKIVDVIGAKVITREILSSSEEMTIRLGRALGRILRMGDVVFLLGELGAGKTRLAKGIVSSATQLHPDEVVSPTFTLVNTYEGDLIVNHADLYRIDAGQIDGLGLEDSLEDGALLIEWAEKLTDFSDDPLRVTLEHLGIAERRIRFEFDGCGSWPARVSQAIESVESA